MLTWQILKWQPREISFANKASHSWSMGHTFIPQFEDFVHARNARASDQENQINGEDDMQQNLGWDRVYEFQTCS